MLCATNTMVILFAFWAFYGEMIWYFLISIFFTTFIVPSVLFITFDKEWYKPIILAPIYIFGMSYFMITLQFYSIANIHNLTWGNRDTGLDVNLKETSNAAK